MCAEDQESLLQRLDFSDTAGFADVPLQHRGLEASEIHTRHVDIHSHNNMCVPQCTCLYIYIYDMCKHVYLHNLYMCVYAYIYSLA